MKKNLIILVAAMLVAACTKSHDSVVVMQQKRATAISKEQALKNLYGELKFIDGETRADGSSRTVKSIQPLTGAVTRSGNALSNDLLYIVEFEEGEGSAVLAADTRLKPVIAVLDSDVLTEADFASEDMDDVSVYIASMIEDYAEDAVSVASEGLLPAPGHTVVDTIYQVNIPGMLKTKWHQDAPYNNLCVASDGSSVSAGCAAIAIAQFAYYHQSPDTINGYTVNWELLSNCEYQGVTDFDGGIVGGTIGGGNFGIILDPNALAHREVARFVYNIGVTAGIDYAGGYPGASQFGMEWCLNALGYDGSFVTYNSYSVRTTMQSGKPVMVVGYNAQGDGHAWLVDGWKQCTIRTTTASEMPEGPVGSVSPEYTVTEEYFDRVHCNFGWGGECDGYYIGDIFDCRYLNSYIDPFSGDLPYAQDNAAYCFDRGLVMFNY